MVSPHDAAGTGVHAGLAETCIIYYVFSAPARRGTQYVACVKRTRGDWNRGVRGWITGSNVDPEPAFITISMLITATE
jgi:hypothetical protein